MISENKLKILPIGESTFKDIVNDNKLYVNKTKDTYNKYFFLSRPRRFGKSLLIKLIKEIKNPKSPHRKYILDYPNMEVEDSLLTSILVGISSYRNAQIVIDDLTEKIQENDLSGFFDIFKYRVFAEIPNEIFMSDKKKYYHTIIYLVLTLIGVRINVEISTNIGRIDAVIENNDNIYIFEFKMNSVKQAIKQIEEKKYYEKYLLKNKSIYLVGVSFDSEIRNIKEWKIQEMLKGK